MGCNPTLAPCLFEQPALSLLGFLEDFLHLLAPDDFLFQFQVRGGDPAVADFRNTQLLKQRLRRVAGAPQLRILFFEFVEPSPGISLRGGLGGGRGVYSSGLRSAVARGGG